MYQSWHNGGKLISNIDQKQFPEREAAFCFLIRAVNRQKLIPPD